MDAGALVNEQYKIIEHIGRGGMADVWSARDTRLRRMVAIKTIVAGLSNDIDPVDLFKREAHTIAQMEHPHILPIYDFGEHDNNLYIVMRYVTGGSLEDLLRDGPMPPQEVLRMGDAIAQALDYAHQNNVIHLDLKPPNILLDSSGAPYLADFGLATVLDPEGRARNPGSGTLLYMAPEQMMSDTIDHRADIYAFSIMLYHMLTGILPFDGNVPLSMSQ
ncbi:MAG: serine/threonine-protein kinase, partial [Chloroflexota bacterium]